MSHFLQELSQSIRSLLRYPQLSGMAVLMLALGIGASTAIYCVLNATLLSPPDYRQPDQLVAVWGVIPTRDIDTWPFAPSDLEQLRIGTTLFDDLGAAFGNNHVYNPPAGEAEQVTSVGMTWNLFSVLGVNPVVGRNFIATDAAFSANDVPANAQPPADTFNPANTVILSHAFWHSHFNGDESVIGTQIYLDELPVNVVGVMPEGFQLLMPGQVPATPDMFEAMRVDLVNEPGANVFLNVVGRIKPDISLDQAQAEIDAVTERIIEDNPIYTQSGFHNRLVPLQQELTKDVQVVVWMLTGTVLFILLIACANVANLLLVRATAMQRDNAIRSALGCSRGRLVRRCLLETLLLASAGTALGIILALAALPAMIAVQPDNLPQLDNVSLNMNVLAVVVLITAGSTLLAGVLPGLLISDRQFSGLRDRSANQESRSSGRWRNALVISEVALSFVLLIGAGLMIRSFGELISADPGFETDNRITFSYVLPNARYPENGDALAFHEQFKQRIQQLPGVQQVGGIFPLPLTVTNLGSRYAPDLESFTSGSARQAQYRFVYPGYFEATDTGLIAGRFINQYDQDTGQLNVVINEALLQRAWPELTNSSDALDRTVYMRGATPEPLALTVVGVIEHQTQFSLDEEPVETLYISNRLTADIGFGTGVQWVVHAEGDSQALLQPIRQQLQNLDSAVPLVQVDTLENIVAQSTGPTRFAMLLISVLGSLALVLASIGLYGVLAYRVRQRMPELGIRLTFGASRGNIYSLVVKQGMLLAGIGLLLGIPVALGLSRLLGSLLVGISASDPLTYIAIGATFLLVALLACSMPAVRAMRIDPAVVLRAD